MTVLSAATRLGLRLLHLLRREVQHDLLVQDRFPCEILPHRLVEVLQAGLVRREEDERVAIKAGRVAARLEDRLGGRLGGAARLLAVGMVDPQHDQARVEVVGHVLARLRHGMDAAEVARCCAGRPAAAGPARAPPCRDRVSVARHGRPPAW